MAEQVDDTHLDERVRKLVEVFGDLPGINALSSCGGKSNPGHRGRRAPDEFSVDFNVDVLAGGWRSLNILVFATSQTDSFENFSVTAWLNTDEPTDCLSFQLRGIKTADSDELASAIERVLEGDFTGHDEPSRQLGD
jgi:hypothetical protein